MYMYIPWYLHTYLYNIYIYIFMLLYYDIYDIVPQSFAAFFFCTLFTSFYRRNLCGILYTNDFTPVNTGGDLLR